ncbi:uroporphyrinogen-III C-methyltransferase [Blastococcus mobilis]|uniref:Uroporphyrinogen-III C-methyltransferase n=1 Tax=Blastococcus mobilis TaxID=1938746 RepID=A0A238YCL3_9ACTN|nr:uroporphyrinogen-III C-methyltransferase [Blastococcus mobilis]SNR68965.1 uroporphyrinogen-III C-methyltransferase [Blastococcus mobilis]
MTALFQDVHDLYPVGLRLLDRRVVVVGGGPAAHRRTVGLLEAGARVTVVCAQLTPALEALAAAGALTWISRDYRPGDLDGAWYAVAAADTPTVDAAVAADAEAARIFCGGGDEARALSARTPAVGRSGDLLVTVHGGTDPRHEAGLRDAIVTGLGDGGITARTPEAGRTGGVVLVGGGPGDPGLITVRGRQALTQADVVVADHLAPQALLASLSADVQVIDASKLPRGRSMAQEQINALLVEHALAGRRVVRLKGGDPFVFGRGMEELEACAAAGVPVEVVPGVTSAIGVPGLAGIPVTHRGMTHEFVVVSGHVPPDDPTSLVDWAALGRLRGTLVVLMGVDTAPAIAAALMRHGRAPDTPVAVITDGASAAQRLLRTTLSGLPSTMADQAVRPPAVWVVGEVVRLATPPGSAWEGSPNLLA